MRVIVYSVLMSLHEITESAATYVTPGINVSAPGPHVATFVVTVTYFAPGTRREIGQLVYSVNGTPYPGAFQQGITELVLRTIEANASDPDAYVWTTLTIFDADSDLKWLRSFGAPGPSYHYNA